MNPTAIQTPCEIPPATMKHDVAPALVRAPKHAQGTGLGDVVIQSNRHTYQIHSVLCEGRAFTLYRASYLEGDEQRGAVIKASRSHEYKGLAAEAKTLQALLA